MFNVQPLIQYLHTHPHSIGIIAFITVFLEAMAIVGVIIPGSITMSIIGALIGSNVAPAGSTFLYAICGAITGDYLSYLIGVYYKERLHNIWPFKKHPEFLAKSERFFARHGGKSVFLGCFVGPMRAMVPMVAGMLKMPQSKFLFAAIPSASIWAIAYMMPGVIVGAVSLELPPKVAAQFILGALTTLITVWLLVWLLHHFARQIYLFFDEIVMRLWSFCKNHLSLRWITKLLEDPREPDNHQQLALLMVTLLALILFFVLFVNIKSHGILTVLNEPFYYFITSFRVPRLDRIMIAFTALGTVKVMTLIVALFSLWLILKRQWFVAVHFLLLMLIASGSICIFKLLSHSPRPFLEACFCRDHDYSFPSGHTVFAVTIFGFWAVLVNRELDKSKRHLSYITVIIFVFFIALSRLYLGAHWLTDILGGLLGGIALLTLFTLSYRRRHAVHLPLRDSIWIFWGIVIVVWLMYCLFSFPKMEREYAFAWPEHTITLHDLRTGQPIADLPLYRANRLGKPSQAFNVRWLGNLDTIRATLTEQGWDTQPTSLDIQGVIKRLLDGNVYSHLSLLPQLYHNQSPALIMTKFTDREDTLLILQLWKSDLIVQGEQLPLWLGVINYSRESPRILGFYHKHNKFIGATEELAGDLGKFHWTKQIYPNAMQPEIMTKLHWDGEVFVITPKN